MEKDPPPLCYARPREENILEWYLAVNVADTGISSCAVLQIRLTKEANIGDSFYFRETIHSSHRMLSKLCSANFSGIKVQTPSGRFQPDTKICTVRKSLILLMQSMSDFHPGSWNPAWSVSSMYVDFGRL